MQNRKIKTSYNPETHRWEVTDLQTGETLCSHCEAFHGGGYGWRTRRLARAAIRRVTQEDQVVLTGGLH